MPLQCSQALSNLLELLKTEERRTPATAVAAGGRKAAAHAAESAAAATAAVIGSLQLHQEAVLAQALALESTWNLEHSAALEWPRVSIE